MRRSNQSALLRAAVAAAIYTSASSVFAADASQLDTVTVTATRVEANLYDVPAAISSVSADTLREGFGVNFADGVAEVPGLLARNRNNYAQDQQVSIRGFGASSAFGIRGIRVYQDGMPASGPDGQGQVSQFNLDSASRVEVLRGPFSALYGNSSGGVIQIFTGDGQGPVQWRDSAAYGSYDTWRVSTGVSGSMDRWHYNASFTHFAVDGYREHSKARSESFNAKIGYDLNDTNKLTFLANFISRPDTDDPLGLTQARFDADPDQTDPAALSFDTRKSLQQLQVGTIYDVEVNDANSIRVMGYFGKRSVEQFLSVIFNAQIPATSSGGVIDLDRKYGGGDARWVWESELGGKPFALIVGASYDKQNEERKGYENYIGAFFGVKGNLRRDEDNDVYDFDQYVQATWDFADAWSAMLGVRHTDVHFDSDDHYLVNGPDSGATSYDSTSPVAGVMFKPVPWLHAYASYGQGFQTPIGAEIAYRADGGAGLNLKLKPAESNNAELGAKIRISDNLSGEVALFQARTKDDIVLNTNAGGRSTYQNADTQRKGAELSATYRIVDSLRVQATYTYVDATYDGSFLTCAGAPCLVPNVLVRDGKSLPGVPRNNGYLSVRWGLDTGWNASVSAQSLSSVTVADVNEVTAPGYTTVDVGGGYVADMKWARLSAFVRVNNVTDERYVGSIIVGDGNQRYFEPAPGCNVMAGVSVSWK